MNCTLPPCHSSTGSFFSRSKCSWLPETNSTVNGRTLNVYGKNTAYSAATDLYSTSTQGTKLGTIVKGTSTEFTITGDYTYIGVRSNSDAMYLTSISIDWEVESGNPDCSHEETAWVYNSEAKEHYQQCVACEAEIDNTRAACSEFTYGDYTTENGVHTRTATCTVCNGAQTESGTCEINAAYTRNGNTHTQTGTCSICGDTTSLTEDCTLTYTNTPNGDKTHTMTSSCSVCEIDSAPEIVDCTFASEADGLTVTHTCKYCDYSYDEEVAGYTVTYVVPNGVSAVDAVEVAQGYTTELPTADAIEGYTFVGWVEATLAEKTEIAPDYLAAGAQYTVTEDVTLYALYTYKEGTGEYTMVTDETTLAVGKQIVIVASGSAYALGSNQASNNRTAVAVKKSSDIVTWTTSVQIITLETGTSEGTWAFNVSNGYLFAASSSSNYLRTEPTLSANSSWSITITAEGIATIQAQGSNTRNLLKKNSSSDLFACYASGQHDVSIYMKDGATYYVTEFNTCAHEDTTETIESATCTESGSRTVTCNTCGYEIESEIIPALGHDYVDGICKNCGKIDPGSIVYDGYYYLSVNGKYAGEKDSKYYKLFDTLPDGNVDFNYVFYFVNNGETYDMYNAKAGLIYNAVTIETQEDYSVRILNSEEKILSHNTGYTTYQRLGFYATSNNYPAAITLTPVDFNVNIDSASVTVGDSLTVNYKVSMPAAYADAVMHFTLDGKTEEVSGTLVGTQYVFSLPVPPQAMADNIVAELYFGEMVIASKATYSIQEYAQNKLNDAGSSAELKRLVSDMLYYGAAAQIYKDYNTDNLATADVENILPAEDKAPTESIFKLENAEVTEYPAYIASAGVYFDGVNQLYIKLNTIENVKVYVTIGEGERYEANLTGTTYYTDGISATGFATKYVFEVEYDGVLMQTLTYSVDAYVYAKKGHAEIGELALALYRYGKSAEAYKNA